MRQWMIKKREALQLSRYEMAKLCCCSEDLLWMLESGDTVTHPNIASRIAYRYKLTLKQYNDLVLEKYRANELPPPKEPPTDEDYFADKYASTIRYKSKQR